MLIYSSTSSILISLVLLSYHLCSTKQWIPNPPNHIDSLFDIALEEKVSETLRRLHIPGLSLAIVNGSNTYAKGYGLASLPSTPATPETLYYGGSTSKAFTAAAISLLVDNKTVQWNTPISSLIRDDFVLSDDYATMHITLEDAVSHRTGLPRHDLILGKTNTTIRNIVRSLRYLPMTAEIRTRFQYCNLMFITLGYVVEHLTSLPLREFLHSRIWEPLGMKATYLSREDAIASPYHLANGYAWNNATGEYVELPWSPTTLDGGAGAIISNVVDDVKWLRMMIQQSSPISKEGHKALMMPRSVIVPEMFGLRPETITGDVVYSAGWWKYTYRGQQVVTHSGSITGFGALVLYLPGLEWGVVGMANTQGTSAYANSALAHWLMDKMLGVPESERFDWLKAYEDDKAKAEDVQAHARELLYPSLPSTPLPPSLPLDHYTGTYTHKAYPTFVITRHGAGLRTIMNNDYFAISVDFEHVSGEYWLATARTLDTNSTKGVSRAEFRIGVAGEVIEAGYEIDGELADLGMKTWFKKEV